MITKGEWYTYQDRFGDWLIVSREDRKHSAVADIPGANDNAEAHAHLIAAAPDMYEACLAAARYDMSICGKAIRGEVDLLANGAGITEDTNLDDLYLDWQVKSKNALTKAEGKCLNY